jgi:hypothetical protein
MLVIQKQTFYVSEYSDLNDSFLESNVITDSEEKDRKTKDKYERNRIYISMVILHKKLIAI